jgi:twinkle protein
MVLGLERNGQADEEKERNTTRVRVLKNRFAGLTGQACSLVYSKYTGRMVETEDEKL